MKFDVDEISRCHKDAVLKTTSLLKTTEDVGEALSARHPQDKLERRKCFLKVLSKVRFLAKQGLSLQGHRAQGGFNFTQLLRLQAEDVLNFMTG